MKLGSTESSYKSKYDKKYEKKTPPWNSNGSCLPNLPLIEETPGHEPSGLRIKNIKHINN
jgi:hypothetical protein